MLSAPGVSVATSVAIGMGVLVGIVATALSPDMLTKLAWLVCASVVSSLLWGVLHDWRLRRRARRRGAA